MIPHQEPAPRPVFRILFAVLLLLSAAVVARDSIGVLMSDGPVLPDCTEPKISRKTSCALGVWLLHTFVPEVLHRVLVGLTALLASAMVVWIAWLVMFRWSR